ncbi:MAG: protein kinase domain-containing protein [Planctomycetota bacterium]|jgi:tetratricopeptide (TPR) repeat protein
MGSDSSEFPLQGDSELYKTPASRFALSSDFKHRGAAHPYEPGSTVSNRYRVLHELGVGGMCTVYLVTDSRHPEHPVALKVVSGDANPVHLEMLRNEFRTLANLEHENLIRVFDFGVLPGNGGFYYTAEYIEGQNLLKSAKGADEDSLINYIAQMCRGLEYVHARGYIHYDVKPSNILVTKNGAIKLTDFGLSALAGRGIGKRIRGTPAYTAPEIITGADISFKADLYSLGITIFEILTGRLPFSGPDLHALFHGIVTNAPPPLRSGNFEIPEYLERIVSRLLAKNPSDRFESANAVIEALSKASGSRIELQPESEAEAYLRMPPLCGRDTELEALRMALDGLGNDRGRYLLIEGPSGIGCTRLLREMHFEAQLLGYATVFGNAGDPEVIRKMGAELAAQPAPAEHSDIPGNDGPRAVHTVMSSDDGVASMVGAAEKFPVVVCIDDIQNAASTVRNSIDRLTKILDTSNALPLLLITARYNSELGESITSSKAVQLQLRPLSLEEIGEVVSRMFGRVPAPELFVSRIMGATGGNPRAIFEMVRMLVASGDIAVIRGKWRFRGGIEPFDIPTTLEEFYSNQIKALSRSLRGFALNLALIDRFSTMKEISVIQNVPSERIAATLIELERRGIIHRNNGLAGISGQGLKDALRFAFATSTLKRRHRHIAEKLSGVRSRKVTSLEICKHFVLSGARKAALQYGISGIESGEVEKDYGAAVPVLELLHRASKNAVPAIRAKILFSFAGALTGMSGPEAVLDIVEEYLSIVPPEEPPERQALMQRYAADCNHRLNRPERAYTAWEKALALVEAGSSEYFGTLVAYASALEYRGQLAECEKLLQDTIARFEGKSNEGVADLLTRLAYLALRRQKLELVSEYADRVFKLAEETGREESPELLLLLATKDFVTDNFEKAESYLEHARKIAIEQKQISLLGRITNNLTLIEFNLGNLEQAMQYAAEVETIWRRYGNFTGLAHLNLTLGAEALRRIGCTQALEYLHKGLEYSRAAGSSMMEYHITARIADASVNLGDFEKALQYCKLADELSGTGRMEQMIFPALTRALALSYTGDTAGAMDSAIKGLELALSKNSAELIVIARQAICRVALLAGNFRLALEQRTHLEEQVSKANLEQRIVAMLVLTDLWFRAGLNEQAFATLERIYAEPGTAKSIVGRASIALLGGKIAMARGRFDEAYKVFGMAENLLGMDKDAAAFIDLRNAEVMLEIFRMDSDAARARLERMVSEIADVPDKAVYFHLTTKCAAARVALLEKKTEDAHVTATEFMHKARETGYRLLELEFAKIAGAASTEQDEIDELESCVTALANEMAEPFEKEIRMAVREHFCSLDI